MVFYMRLSAFKIYNNNVKVNKFTAFYQISFTIKDFIICFNIFLTKNHN
jgi:hypothetical protein